MSLREADYRFLLATPPRTATIAAVLPEVSAAFVQARVELAPAGADVAIAPADQTAAILSGSPEAVIALGRGAARALAGRRPVLRRFITLPSSLAPHVVLPVDRPRVAAYALDTWTASVSPLRRLRTAVARAAIARGRFPELGRTLTLATRDPGAPFILRAAADLGVPAAGDWFLTLGMGDDLTRAVFQVFAPGAQRPDWIIKFARVPGYDDPFLRDERSLALAASSPVAAAHAPRFLGRFVAAGLNGSVETAAVGRRITYLLQGPGPRPAKEAVIDAVASWLLDLAQTTAVPPAELGPERERLAAEVVPAFAGQVPGDLVDRVAGVPGVLQHNDLGCWNLITGSAGFTAVDWESARRPGLPLWDLVYFLVDALLHLEGAEAPAQREQFAARLLLGHAGVASGVLFGWLARAVRALEIPAAAVGPIVTLGWLHHGLSPVTRAALSDALSPAEQADQTFTEWMLRVWLRTPGLGAEWAAYAAHAADG